MNKYDILEHYLHSLQEERDGAALMQANDDTELRQVIKFARDLKVLTSSASSHPSAPFMNELKGRLDAPGSLREAKRSLPLSTPQEDEADEVVPRRRSLWKIWTPAFALVAIGVVALSALQPSGKGGLLSLVTSSNPLTRSFSPQTSVPEDGSAVEIDGGQETVLEAVNEAGADDRKGKSGLRTTPASPFINDASLAFVPLDVSAFPRFRRRWIFLLRP